MGREQFHGPGMDEEKRRIYRTAYYWSREEFGHPVPGEVEKTADQIRQIEMFRTFLRQDLDEFGFPDIEVLPVQRIHFLDHESFQKRINEEEQSKENIHSAAYYHSLENAIYVDVSGRNNFAISQLVLEELLHQVSVLKIHYDRDQYIENIRSGYRTSGKFEGLNEAVIQGIMIGIMDEHAEEISREFGMSMQEYEELSPDRYIVEYMMLYDILKGISKTSGQDFGEVWRKFVLGFFSGEMMFLRDIEKAYGKGALEILAMFSSTLDSETRGQITRYFAIKSPTARMRLSQRILAKQKRSTKK